MYVLEVLAGEETVVELEGGMCYEDGEHLPLTKSPPQNQINRVGDNATS